MANSEAVSLRGGGAVQAKTTRQAGASVGYLLPGE